MTWAETYDVLFEALLSLPAVSPAERELRRRYWALNLESMRARLAQEDAGVKSSIRVYARSRQWPDLNADETLFLHWRLDGAIEALWMLSYAEERLGISEPTQDEEALIEWALLDLWDIRGYDENYRSLAALASDLSSSNPSDDAATGG